MAYESFEDYQYDSCISRGICSINPRLSALQAVIVLYLGLYSRYALNLKVEKKSKEFILNTLSITIYNTEFNEESFLYAIEKFKVELDKIIDKFYETNSGNNFLVEKEKALELYQETIDIINAIRYGEKILNRSFEKIPVEIRDFYSIMLVIAKSLSINLLDLESYDKDYEKAFSTILSLLNKINLEEKDIEVLKTEICVAAETDLELMKLIREVQEEQYGKQKVSEVSYSTVPGKAVLIVGSNIKELELILEALKEKDIDIYTHDEMMLAYTFPKFANYKNLKGQFGQGVENCLLDFATFPGPIILTKHSLHNIENLYRGRLFTTDYMTLPKGIIKIENNDLRELIETTEKTKGFKTGRQCETVSIGYDYDEVIFEIDKKISSGKFNHIFVIGLDGYSLEQNSYFEKLLKLTPQNVLILSFSCNFERENLIHINTCFDNYSWIKVFEYIKGLNISTTVFVPKCERSTISQLVYISKFDSVKLYLGKCTPIILNPSLMQTLQKTFKIKAMTTTKKDLGNILGD